MSNIQIAAELAGAYREVAREVGDGDASATIIVGVTQTTPWGSPSGTETEYAATAMQKRLTLAKIDGTLIQAGDIVIGVAQPEIIPTTAMRIRWKGITYRIIVVMPLSFAGDIKYELLCRV